MAININKGGKLGKYFFIADDIQFGPFEISDLLEQINKDSLVYYEGIKWTKASEIPELKKYFITEQRVVESVVERIVEVPATNNNYGLMFILLFIVLGGIYWFYNDSIKEQNNKYEQHQKSMADSLATLNLKLLKQAQQDSINNAINLRLDSLKINENKINFLQNQSLLSDKVKNYYLDISNDEFNASNYYANQVNQFINLTNITPEEINYDFSNKQDYTNENFAFDESTFVFQREFENIYYFNYSINYNCFRTRKNQTQTCDVDIEIGFDENFKIKSYKELEIRNLSFE